MRTILAIIAALLLPSCQFLTPKTPYVPPADILAGHANFCNSLTQP